MRSLNCLGEWEVFSRQSIRILPFAALIAATLALSGCGINTIPSYEQDAKAKWAEIQNQYKRRADLVPNLVESVRGFADQEKTVLTNVIEARAKATQAQVNLPADILTNPDAMKKFAEAQNQLSGAIGRLLAVSERYPDIKSGANFMALQNQLEGTENRIAIARRDYINAVQNFNTELNTFPGRIWKSILYSDKKDMAQLEVPAQDLETPKVDFGPRKS